VASCLRAVVNKQDAPPYLQVAIATTLVFAVQMLTLPGKALLPSHIIGGFALAIVFGLNIASVLMAAVVLVQAFLFGDGGVYALGANYLNLGIIAIVPGVYLFNAIRQLGDDLIWSASAVFVSVVFTTLLSAGAVGLETSIGKSGEIVSSISNMIYGSAVPALIEGVLTALLYWYFAVRKPMLLNAEFAPDRHD
jgi:cobalt/nickel transport system permease protein